MTQADDPLKLDKNPTPKDEARDFQNPDERLKAADYAHEIALIAHRKGTIGRLTGSTNEAMNTGTFILIMCLVLLAGSMVGIGFNPTAFGPVTDNLFKVVLAVAGYIFGTKNASK